VPPLVVINQIHPILARFAVPDRELARVQKFARERSLKVTATTATGGSGVVGSLNFIDNGVDSTTGTVTLKARFDNADNALWPGQFVSVALELFVEPAAILVPTPAVQPGQDGGQFVFTVDREGKVQVVNVVAGRAIGDMTVIEKGLEAGERVVTDGQSRITPGAKVAVRAADAPSSQRIGADAGSSTGASGSPGRPAAGDGSKRPARPAPSTTKAP
jgi:multidrug efflux system membrane fusion protein